MKKQRRVIIGDDNREVAHSLQQALQRYAFVDIAHSASHVIEACDTNLYDAVILDVEFGYGISGLEAAGIIREAHPEFRIIIISALDYSTDVQQRTVELGAVFLQKTVTTEQLTSALDLGDLE